MRRNALRLLLPTCYRYDGYGNLLRLGHFGLWPNSGTGPVAESFSYDRLHRLTQSSRSSAGIPANETVQYRYDVIGHLLAKSDWSSAAPGGCTATATSTCPYQYQTGSHRIASVAQAGGSISYTHDGNGNVIQKSGGGITHSLLYDADNLPQRLSSSDRISDFYTLAGARYRHLARSGSGSVLRETVHLDKSYERETANGQTIERYYLSSDVLLTVQGGTRSLNYLHSDRLGSPVSITGRNASGPMEMKEHRGFDAFGKARDGQWGNSAQGKLYPSTTPYHLAKPNLRGFTQHEHLDEFALIHMNGRLYDPHLGRFYGVDPIIQFPSNSQSLNPYSYLMNNPLAGTDPTGYVVCTGSRLDLEDTKCGDKGVGSDVYNPASGPAASASASNGAQQTQSPGDASKASKGKPENIGAPATRLPQIVITPSDQEILTSGNPDLIREWHNRDAAEAFGWFGKTVATGVGCTFFTAACMGYGLVDGSEKLAAGDQKGALISFGSVATVGVLSKLPTAPASVARGPVTLRNATEMPVGGNGMVLRDGQGATAAEVHASASGPGAGTRAGQSARRQELVDDANANSGGVYSCWRCGQTSTNPGDMHLGHRNVSTSQGGNMSRTNTCLEGAACNLSSGNRGAPGPGMSCAERGSCGAPYDR